MNNAKWIVFGCCFLAIVGAAAVWYVERKIAQVTGVVSGAVQSASELPRKAIDEAAKVIGDAPEKAWKATGETIVSTLRAYPNARKAWYDQQRAEMKEKLAREAEVWQANAREQ